MPDVVYADYQSSKPVDPRVVEAMLPYFAGTFGNAASLHAVGDEATAALDESAKDGKARPLELKVAVSEAAVTSAIARISACPPPRTATGPPIGTASSQRSTSTPATPYTRRRPSW